MKRYVNNKNFIPITFLESLNIISNEKNNKLIFILVLINLFIVPTSISKISNELKNNEAVSVISIDDTKKDINKENLILLLKFINNGIKNIRIQNNSGFIEVDSMDKIYSIEEDKNFNIKSAVMKDNIITVEVEL